MPLHDDTADWCSHGMSTFNSVVGNIFRRHIYDIYHNEKMDAFRQHERFEKCSLLKFCRGCPAVAYGYTHNFYAPDLNAGKQFDLSPMNEVIKAIMERRATRHFAPQQIKPEELQQILDAGLYAPIGGGRQSPIMLVCQDSEINAQLGRLNRAFFGKANSNSSHFVSPTQKSIADDDSIQNAFYDAPWSSRSLPPTMAIWHPRLHLNSHHHVACRMVAEYRQLETFATELGRKLQVQANIGDKYIARVHLCLGYPSGDLGGGKPRKEGRARYI